MKQVLIREGRAVVTEMPRPACGAGEILVRTAFSLISPGTESSALRGTAPGPSAEVWQRRGRRAGEVVRLVKDRGLRGAAAAVRARLEGGSVASGYSLAGTVVQTGDGVGDLVPGQRVACAGDDCAHHAELVAVPRLLAVPVPENVDLQRAAWVTLGAIALNSVRQAATQLGDLVCVSGLGPIGQLAAELLCASGCRVIATDLDPGRVERARGIPRLIDALVEQQDDVEAALARHGAGRGADAVLVAAATPSSEPVLRAVDRLRLRGRLVVVGAVGLDLDRDAFYAKEVELRVARSYGPGRHDPAYERDGRDYPYPYVRWTENRNMSEFLRLVSTGAIDPARLVDRVHPLEEAPLAYEALGADAGSRPLGVLLAYPDAPDPAARDAADRSVEVVDPGRSGGLRVAVVGPGSFASQVHLPNVAELGELATLRWIVGSSPDRAREAARRWAAQRATTDLDEALGDPDLDAVLICTRHDLHAEQATRALRAGKAVFLEKPAALTHEELSRLEQAIAESALPFTLGLNRRFAPAVTAFRTRLAARHGPLDLHYRVRAEPLPTGHWATGPAGGGRILGEACHMIDLMQLLVDSPRVGHRLLTAPTGPDAPCRGDRFALACSYADGSLATLHYSTAGDASAGKERLEARWDDRSEAIEDFSTPRSGRADKGHRALLEGFLQHVTGGPEPIPLDAILNVSRFVLDLDVESRGAPREP
jgi:predicted dehydrogenase/threonine dehydrogenase-like Zn-dependent dehydrogenase